MKKAVSLSVFFAAVVALLVCTALLMWPTPSHTVSALLADLDAGGDRVGFAGFALGDRRPAAGEGPVARAAFSRLGTYGGEVLAWNGETGSCEHVLVRFNDLPIDHPLKNAGLRLEQLEELYWLAQHALSVRSAPEPEQHWQGKDGLGYPMMGRLFRLPGGRVLELELAQADDNCSFTMRVLTTAAWHRIAARRAAEWTNFTLEPVAQETPAYH